MSPSESDLRAALHDGEGGSPNVDLVIMKAEVRVAQRRTRLLSAAIVVGVVASAGVGIGFLSNSNQEEKAAQSANQPARVTAGVKGNPGAAAAGGSAAYSRVYDCPTAAATGTDQAPTLSATSHSSMFSTDVSTVVLCAYNGLAASKDSSRRPETTADRVVLHGKQAAQLVQSLKRAPKTRPTQPCPMVRTVSRPLVIYAFSSSGKVAGVASTDLGVPVCNVVSFSNRDVRYNWTAPFDLAPIMGSLAPVSAPTAQPTH